MNAQEAIYPENYVKLRYLENHDQLRAAYMIPDGAALVNWTAFLYFQKGATLVYNGQEAACAHTPSLFDRDTIAWDTGCDMAGLLRALYAVKKHPLLTRSCYEVKALAGEVLYATHRADGKQLTGIFSVKGRPALVKVDVPEGGMKTWQAEAWWRSAAGL